MNRIIDEKKTKWATSIFKIMSGLSFIGLATEAFYFIKGNSELSRDRTIVLFVIACFASLTYAISGEITFYKKEIKDEKQNKKESREDESNVE